MKDQPTLPGIHHITAIAADPQPNYNFYAKFLGLRFVKKTVNFDDPGTYHLYYGDHTGSPGSIITFFPWVGSRRGRQGSGQVTATAFSVPHGSLPYWADRAKQHGVPFGETVQRFGIEIATLQDPDGMKVELAASLEDDSEDSAVKFFEVPTLALEGYERTARLLTDIMGFQEAGQEGSRFRFKAPGDGPASEVDLLCSPDAHTGLGGAGTVHHIAWRTPDGEQQERWRERLASAGFNVTPVIDRQYFHSIYFREPGGILFEIATNPPGFTADEPEETLGSQLMLPPQYESLRARIEQSLPPLRTSA